MSTKSDIHTSALDGGGGVSSLLMSFFLLSVGCHFRIHMLSLILKSLRADPLWKKKGRNFISKTLGSIKSIILVLQR